jgi:hypothetical protein
VRYRRSLSNESISPSDSGREARLDSRDDEGRAYDSRDRLSLSRDGVWREEGRAKGFILVKMSIVGSVIMSKVSNVRSHYRRCLQVDQTVVDVEVDSTLNKVITHIHKFNLPFP